MNNPVEKSVNIDKVQGLRAAVPPPAQARQRPGWVLVAVVLTVGGVIGSLFAANAAAGSVAAKSRRTFESSSQQVASALALSIQHEEDLVVNVSVYVLGNPNASNAQLLAWTTAGRVAERFPELKDIGLVQLVQAVDLPAFTARVEADRPDTSTSPVAYQIVPAGDRPYYCLTKLAAIFESTAITVDGLDLCASGADPVLMAARDSGVGAYLPFPIADKVLLGIETPIYAGAVIPATVEARRAAFVGWVGTVTDPEVVLARALHGHPGMAVSMRYHLDVSDTSFSNGDVPKGATSTVIDLGNGWTVTTFTTVASGALLQSGTPMALLVAGVLLSVMLGGLVFLLATGRARARKQLEAKTVELQFLALHDALTGLPNRALIMDRIEQLLVRNRRNRTQGAVLFVDLDEFKNVNDTLGHEAGDRLLVAVAGRLTAALRDADTIGRMGGDEFVVLIDGAATAMAPELVADRLLEVMRRPFDFAGAAMPLMVSTSIGIAVGDRESAGDLLRDADVALYQAKAAGKDRYDVFDPEMQSEVSQRMSLEFDLRSALDGNQFRLVYQPVYNLDDLSLVAVEALLRWDHPTAGTIEPDDFIPLLEKTGQIREVGRWVLDRACTQMAEWHAKGDTLDVSVNVSGRQLDHDDIVDHIHEALAKSGLDPAALIIEVTETALMHDTEQTARRLQAVKALGVRIAVDDFGTGYSSLAYLQKFPVDCLKIDRSFTHALTTSPESKALIHTLVQLGKDLGLKTLAEGVETIGEMDHLRGEQVNEAQGFLLSKPLDPETLEAQILAPIRFEAPHTT